MPRSPRKNSEGDIYHVYARGVGRQIIFEDDTDRTCFLSMLKKQLDESNGKLLAWVLMGNHFHLLVNIPLDVLPSFMRDLQAPYATYFNKRHGHDGHIFKGRFGSQAITSDEQLVACVRYIHRNPVAGGLCETCDYRWSSYRSYLRKASVTDAALVLDLFGGIEQFVEFHDAEDNGKFSFIDVEDGDAGDSRANKLACALLGEDWRNTLPNLSKPNRDSALRQLKEAGISIRQIERLTGIGRNIISRA